MSAKEKQDRPETKDAVQDLDARPQSDATDESVKGGGYALGGRSQPVESGVEIERNVEIE